MGDSLVERLREAFTLVKGDDPWEGETPMGERLDSYGHHRCGCSWDSGPYAVHCSAHDPATHLEQVISESADKLESLEAQVEQLRGVEAAATKAMVILERTRRIPTDCWGNPDVSSRDWPTPDEVAKAVANAVSELAAALTPNPTADTEEGTVSDELSHLEACVRSTITSILFAAPEMVAVHLQRLAGEVPWPESNPNPFAADTEANSKRTPSKSRNLESGAEAVEGKKP